MAAIGNCSIPFSDFWIVIFTTRWNPLPFYTAINFYNTNHMKQKKNFQSLGHLSLIFIVVLLIACSSSSKSVSAGEFPQAMVDAINNNHWVFTPRNVMPDYGRTRTADGFYYVSCQNDSLLVALPYFGRLNTPGGFSSANPLDFRSTNNDINKGERKGDRWVVTIKPDNSEVRSMIFTFYDNGNTQLSVTMTNRTGISYSGRMEPGRLPKK